MHTLNYLSITESQLVAQTIETGGARIPIGDLAWI